MPCPHNRIAILRTPLECDIVVPAVCRECGEKIMVGVTTYWNADYRQDGEDGTYTRHDGVRISVVVKEDE